MTNANSSGASTPYQVLIQTKLEAEKAGKKEVSTFEYFKLQVLRFLIVGGNACFNAFYGYSLGVSLVSMVLLAITFFSGDFALAVITELTSKTRSINFLSKLAILGLFFLSLTAGMSFMLSQRHSKNVENSRVGELEKQIAINTELFSKYHKTITANRIAFLRSELEAERARVGANYSSANALPLYVSKWLKIDVEIVSLWLSGLWVLVLLITGLSLSAVSSLLYSPWHERRLINGVITQIKTQKELNSKLEKLTDKPKKPRSPEDKSRERRSPTFDTGTKGDNSIRYHKVKEQVTNGKVKPTVPALKSLGIGTQTAVSYLKSMSDEGVIRRNKNRYALT
jgi:hypothetical protein